MKGDELGTYPSRQKCLVTEVVQDLQDCCLETSNRYFTDFDQKEGGEYDLNKKKSLWLRDFSPRWDRQVKCRVRVTDRVSFTYLITKVSIVSYFSEKGFSFSKKRGFVEREG